MTSALFTPTSIGPLTLENRIVVAPMCQYSAEDGQAGDWHTMHLGTLALSGAGLLILEATAVEPQGRISPTDLGLWSDGCETALARVLAAVRANAAAPIGIQLGHAGRKASVGAPWNGGGQLSLADGGWEPEAPSAAPHTPGDRPSRPLGADGLARVRSAFAAAAQRAVRLGLDAIEVHAAHGYLLHQFLSPLANQRDDTYGGSLANRLRFPLEVFRAVREAAPGIAVGVRVSATDWVPGGWDLEQTLAFAEAVRAAGADFIDVSSGGVSPQQAITLAPGYQVPFAEAVKQAVGLPTMAVGLITDPHHAEAIVAEGKADMVALARGILYDPRWPWHAAAALGATLRAPRQYLRCQPREHKSLFDATPMEPRGVA